MPKAGVGAEGAPKAGCAGAEPPNAKLGPFDADAEKLNPD